MSGWRVVAGMSMSSYCAVPAWRWVITALSAAADVTEMWCVQWSASCVGCQRQLDSATVVFIVPLSAPFTSLWLQSFTALLRWPAASLNEGNWKTWSFIHGPTVRSWCTWLRAWDSVFDRSFVGTAREYCSLVKATRFRAKALPSICSKFTPQCHWCIQTTEGICGFRSNLQWVINFSEKIICSHVQHDER